MTLTIQHDLENKRFYTTVDGLNCTVDYSEIDENTILLVSTYVPSALRGRGIAAELVAHALTYAKKHNLKIVSRCSYVDSYITSHPEFNNLLRVG